MKEWKQPFRDVIAISDFKCNCLSRSFHVKDDNSIICANCKREFDMVLKEKE